MLGMTSITPATPDWVITRLQLGTKDPNLSSAFEQGQCMTRGLDLTDLNPRSLPHGESMSRAECVAIINFFRANPVPSIPWKDAQIIWGRLFSERGCQAQFYPRELPNDLAL